MKKYISLMTCILFACTAIRAQALSESPSNPAVPVKQVLPKAGDFAIGINFAPFVEFIGNAFNGYGTDGSRNTIGSVGGSILDLNFAPKPIVSLMGKYLITDNVAFRLNLGMLSQSNFQRAYVTSDELQVTDPLSEEKLIDCKSSYNSGGSIALGLEYRIGQNRIQGILGGDLLFAYQTQKDVYQYGNELSIINSNPTTSSIMPGFDASGYRASKKYYGDIFYGGAMLNVGVEYFISPKVALGTEVNMLFCYKMGSSEYEVREGLNQYTNALETRKILTSPGDRSFVLGTGNFGSKLYLMLYF